MELHDKFGSIVATTICEQDLSKENSKNYVNKEMFCCDCMRKDQWFSGLVFKKNEKRQKKWNGCDGDKL